MNLFGQAKKTGAKTTTKKGTEKTRISIDTVEFFENIEDMNTLQTRMKSDKAKLDMISDEVKDLAKVKWAEQFETEGKNPGSVMLESTVNGDTAQVMFIAQDKYITIGEERAEELSETFGEDIVSEDTTFSFDSRMIAKYGEVLSNLIMGSDDIEEADKAKIIKAATKYSVAKGTIEKLDNYGDVSSVMEAVRPVVMLKGPEVING